MQTTYYLLGTPANREHLLSALDDIRNKRNLVEVPIESTEERRSPFTRGAFEEAQSWTTEDPKALSWINGFINKDKSCPFRRHRKPGTVEAQACWLLVTESHPEASLGLPGDRRDKHHCLPQVPLIKDSTPVR